MTTIVRETDPITVIREYDVVMVPTNIYGELNGLFGSAIKKEYPDISDVNMKQPYGDWRRMGTRITVRKQNEPTVTLMYVYAKNGKLPAFLYPEHFKHALQTANNEFKGKKALISGFTTDERYGGMEPEEMVKVLDANAPDMDIYLFVNNGTNNAKKHKYYKGKNRRTPHKQRIVRELFRKGGIHQ
jgi:hypothetical protein